MSKDKNKVKPPEHLFRVLVEPGGGNGAYPKWEKFWRIEKFNQEHSNHVGHVVYDTVERGGVAVTNFFMWRAIRKKLRRLNVGYTGKYYTVDGKEIKQ